MGRTLLSHDLGHFNNASGAEDLTAWVKTSLSATEDTTIYMYCNTLPPRTVIRLPVAGVALLVVAGMFAYLAQSAQRERAARFAKISFSQGYCWRQGCPDFMFYEA